MLFEFSISNRLPNSGSFFLIQGTLHITFTQYCRSPNIHPLWNKSSTPKFPGTWQSGFSCHGWDVHKGFSGWNFNIRPFLNHHFTLRGGSSRNCSLNSWRPMETFQQQTSLAHLLHYFSIQPKVGLWPFHGHPKMVWPSSTLSRCCGCWLAIWSYLRQKVRIRIWDFGWLCLTRCFLRMVGSQTQNKFCKMEDALESNM